MGCQCSGIARPGFEWWLGFQRTDTVARGWEMNQRASEITVEAFHRACEVGAFEVVKRFVDQGVYPLDVISKGGWTGLIIACFNQNHREAKFLVENGANVNATNKNGTTVFMYAKTPIQSVPNNTELLSYLLCHGAKINALDKRNKTVLDYVVENGADELAKWLVQNGAKRSKDLAGTF